MSSQGRLGNNLFQYFFAKILSENLRTDFYIDFSLPTVFGLEYKNYQNTPPNISRLIEEWVSPEVHLMLNGQRISRDFDTILYNTKNLENLFLSGYFQQKKYYSNKRNEIRNSFKYEFKTIENTLGIHVRKGDIEDTINDSPDEWFIQMVEKFPNHKKYVTSDNTRNGLVQKLISMGCELYSDTPEQTILDFSNFSELVLSQGTFSWWMGFLSDGNKHLLRPNNGWNCENSTIDLILDDDNWNIYKLENKKLNKISK